MTGDVTSRQIVPKSPACPEGLFLMDGIEGLRSLPKHSVDMLLTDPPYGTTRNFWDVPLPLPELWEAVKWAVKPDGAVLFFAQCPYDKVLGASNLSMLRYEWVWYKSRCTGFLNARRAPLKRTENILVFYQKLPYYDPQFEQGKPYKKISRTGDNSPNYGKFLRSSSGSEDGLRFPGNLLAFSSVQRTVHPTQKPVRFISLAENVDSYLNPDSVSSIIVPITNVMNDQYCYQTSKKIRQVFDYKRRNGQYIGAFAPYGYVKYPKDKHQLIIDPDAAEIVKLIFSLFLKGTSKRAIALYLNEHGVPSPSAYKLQKGIPVSTRGYDDPMWGARMIHSILTNPTYTGDLAQGRSRVKSYKVHEVESVPREEWVEVAGTHEAIIDYETFDKVQALLQRDTRTSPKGREVHLFSGFLKCADCGRAITRSVGNNNNVYYACSTYKNRSRTACTMHSIKHNRLEAAVLFAVQQQIHLAVSYSEMIARINTAPVKKSQSIRLEELIAAKERELAKISRYKQSLYQDWKDGEITQQDYRDMKADYERQTIALTDVLARLNAERAELANGVKSEHPALVAFTKHQNIDQLSRELLVELIDHIKVYENGNISVRFKFADEFRRIAEYIEINTTKPAVAG